MRWQIVLLGGAVALGGCHGPAPPAPAEPPKIAVGSLFACAAAAGHAACWGDRQLLGNGKRELFPGAALPSPVSGVDDAIGVAAGTSHGCVLRRGGAVACWGAGSGDHFGVGPTPSSEYVTAPLPVRGIAGVEQLVAAGKHTCARLGSGRVLCWGDDAQGEIGQPVSGPTTIVPTPTAVEGIEDAVEIATAEHRTCALKRSGEVDCWGTPTSALFAPCAPGENCSSRAKPDAERRAILEAGRKPSPVPDLRGATAIAAADEYACGVMPSGEIVCTGDDTLSTLGDGRSENRSRTVHVAGITGARRVAAGNWAACAVDETGRVICWGKDPVAGPGGAGTPGVIDGVTDAVDVAVATLSACAATRRGEIVCWGNGKNGLTGHGAAPEPGARKLALPGYP